MTTGHFPALTDSLRRWDGRRRQQELLLWLPRGLTIGFVLALIPALLSRARPLLTGNELALIALALTVVAVVGHGCGRPAPAALPCPTGAFRRPISGVARTHDRGR